MAGKKRLKPLVRRNPRPRTPVSLEKRLLRALDNKELIKARTIIAQMPPDSKTAAKGQRPKQGAYQLLFVHAISNGDIDTALEVAVFANVTVTEKNLLDCMLIARRKGNLRTILECRERLGGKLTIRDDIYPYPALESAPCMIGLCEDCPLLHALIKFCCDNSYRNGWRDVIQKRLAQIYLDPNKGTRLEHKLIALYDWPI